MKVIENGHRHRGWTEFISKSMETDQEEAKQEDGVEIGANFFFLSHIFLFCLRGSGKEENFLSKQKSLS